MEVGKAKRFIKGGYKMSITENFLREYSRSLAESSNRKFTEEQLNDVVNDLMCNDDLFDSIDSYIRDTFDENGILEEE